MPADRSLVVAVLWVDGDVDTAGDKVTEALRGVGIPDAGGVSAFHQANVDPDLRRDLRRVAVDFADVANWTPPEPTQRRIHEPKEGR